MKKLGSVVAAVSLLAAMTAAGASRGAVEIAHFTVADPGAGLGAIDGTVKVDDDGGSLAFTVDLLDDLRFRDAPDKNHWSFGFDLTGGAAALGNISDNGAGSFDAVAGPKSQSPFGAFGYIVDCDSGCSTGWASGAPSELKFTVSRAGGLSLADLTSTNSAAYGNVYFSADVANITGQTGAIGARGPFAEVPEPATWAMMLVGFGALGAILRRRRAQAALAEA